MNVERHIKPFKNGRSEADRITRNFELPATNAIMRKDGGRVIIEPVPVTSLLVPDIYRFLQTSTCYEADIGSASEV